MATAKGGEKLVLRKPVFVKVDQLKPGTTGHTLTVKVVSASLVPARACGGGGVPAFAVGSHPARIAECLVGDETWVIIFTARNEQGKSIDADQRLTLDVDKLTTDLAGLVTGMVKPLVDILWFMHSRLRTHAESIAFFGGGPREKADLDLGRQLHEYVMRNGARCIVRRMSVVMGIVFDEMPERDVFPWNALMTGYVQCKQSKEPLALFHEMQEANVEPDEITMVNILTACCQLGALEMGMWVPRYTEKHQLVLSVELETSLLHMYAKCGNIEKGP
ncbi:hypothetical protein ABZP36_007188 [Zizania latifolia]